MHYTLLISPTLILSPSLKNPAPTGGARHILQKWMQHASTMHAHPTFAVRPTLVLSQLGQLAPPSPSHKQVLLPHVLAGGEDSLNMLEDFLAAIQRSATRQTRTMKATKRRAQSLVPSSVSRYALLCSDHICPFS
jgi:hypothetical protein